MTKKRYPYFNGKPIITVRLEGKFSVSLRVLADTGADNCTAPKEICELLKLKKLQEKEIIIPGGTLSVPMYEGVMAFDDIEKKVKIIGIDIPPRAEIDGLMGREFFNDLKVCFVRGKEMVVER
jgi:predicted aspartyl protease